MDQNDINYDALWLEVISQFPDYLSHIHGPNHWARVEANGLMLAQKTGADLVVVRLFGLFHDSRRENDDHDPDHGRRGAELAEILLPKFAKVSADQRQLLIEACAGHTDGLLSDDPTIGTCWDADRLDLGRVGLVPKPKFMSTAFAKEVAYAGSFQRFVESGVIGNVAPRRP